MVLSTYVPQTLASKLISSTSWQVTPPTLQQSQTQAILQLLNLNNALDSSSSGISTGSTDPKLSVPSTSGPPVWKILVLDQRTKDVLATVLRVQDLRDVGVTLHV